ncbi:MAG: T9SS type A sorting domain-containing protein [Bacteroidales bacterium]
MKKSLLLLIVFSYTMGVYSQGVENELHAFYKERSELVRPIVENHSIPLYQNLNISNQVAPQNEPSVRISRKDPQTVVAAWRDFREGWQEPNVVRRIGYTYSHDGGQTWAESQLLPDPMPDHLSQSDPVVTSDTSGHFYISSTSRQPVTNYNREMLLYKSVDDGVTFDLHAIAVPGSGAMGEDKEWIFHDPVETNPTHNNIFIVWRSFGPSYGIKFRKSADNGTTWSNTVAVSDAGFGQGANVASGVNGEIYTVWLGGGIMFDVSYDGGETFGTDKSISFVYENDYYSFPFICVDYSNKPSRGNIYVVYADNREGTEDIWLQRSEDGGETWLANPIRVNDDASNDQYWPMMQSDLDGNLAVVYYDERTQPGVMNAYLAYSEDQGNTWINTRLSNDHFYGNMPNSNVRFGDYICLDFYDGKIIPVWTDDRTFNYDQEIYSAVIDINTGISVPSGIASGHTLYQNYPNPFREKTEIAFYLDASGKTRIDIYNIMGERVETLLDKDIPPGRHTLAWQPDKLPAGVYICRFTHKQDVISKQMTYLR